MLVEKSGDPAMATCQFHGYAKSALTHNTPAGRVTLRADYDPARDRLLVTITDDDSHPESDQYSDAVGDDASQSAVVTGPDGGLIASGRLRDEIYGTLATPGGGTAFIDHLGVGGVHLGYFSSEALVPGYAYPLTVSADVPSASGSLLGHSQVQSVPGLAAGTMIATDQGEVPVDWLRAGDRVLTRDMGYQPAVWTGRVEVAVDVSPTDAGAVTIAADAFGPGLPARRIRLTPSHRILLTDQALDLHFGEAEMFAAAGDLVDADAVRLAAGGGRQVSYHLLLADHQVILAEGLWVESLFADDRMMAAMPARRRRRIAELIGAGHRQTARACLNAGEILLLPRGRMPVSGRAAA